MGNYTAIITKNDLFKHFLSKTTKLSMILSKNDFLCQICQSILKEPLSLPCSSTCMTSVCREHLTQHTLIITCPKCLVEHQKRSLKDDSLKRSQIEAGLHLSPEERSLKNSLDQIVAATRTTIQELHAKMREFVIMQSDHFFNLRNCIDIQRETILKEMYKKSDVSQERDTQRLSADMIKRIDLAEEAFRAHFATNVKTCLLKAINIDQETHYLEAFLRRFNAFHEKHAYERLKADLEKKQRKVETISRNFKLYKYDLMRASFIERGPNELGELRLFDDYLVDVCNEVVIANVVTFYSQKEVRCLNLNINFILKSFSGHLYGVECLTSIGNKDRLITACRDKTLKVWSVSSGKCLSTLQTHPHHLPLGARFVNCMRMLTSGQLATGSYVASKEHEEWSIKVWDLTVGVCAFGLKGHSETVNCLEELGDHLVSCSNDLTIRVWSLAERKQVGVLREHTAAVYALKVIDSSLFASNSHDGTIKLWNRSSLSTGVSLRTLKPYSRTSVYDLEVTKEQRLLNCCSFSNVIQIWDVSAFECLRVLHTGHSGAMSFIKMNTKTGHLYSGSWDKTIKVWDLNAIECLQMFRTDDEISKVEFLN